MRRHRRSARSCPLSLWEKAGARVVDRAALLLALLLPLAGLAGEQDAADLLRELHPAAGAAEFRYEETRVLELLAAPWHGWGYLLSGADGSLVKLQMFPQRVVMAIVGDRMWYHDHDQNQRRSAPLGAAGAMQQQIAAFRAILQGRADALRDLYMLDAERQGGHWTLRLTARAKPAGIAVASLEMSGEERGKYRNLRIVEADGESTEYRLEKTGEGKSVELTIQRLLGEATGE